LTENSRYDKFSLPPEQLKSRRETQKI